jgi:hypothetical protein
LRKVYSSVAQTPAKLPLRKDRAVGSDQLGIWKVPAAGKVTGADAGPRLGFVAGKASRRAQIYDELLPGGQIGSHGGQITYRLAIESSGEPARRWSDGPLLEGPLFSPPFPDSPVEDGDARVSKHPEHPPDSRCTEIAAGPIVHNEIVSIVQTESFHAPGERRFGRQHVG